MYYQIFEKLYQNAAKRMVSDCQSFIFKNSKILDLGCGSGIVGQEFQKKFEANLIGVDIKDLRIIPIPFELINGLKLPFPDNIFDAVLINFVLHHTDSPLALLEEAKRVSNGKIIIYEDLPENLLSKLRCSIHGASFNKFFKIKNKSSFKTEKEWEDIFNKIKLNIIFKKIVNKFPVKKEMFVLEKA